ncbi:MAG: hypothetical protein QOJ62_76 [Actinomycetota bacterium]|nr:hypothetical protein [Actinomycetota bacterium]
MPLTAEDVKNKQFTHTRMRGGYDEKEVDDFLDEIEAELVRLHRENADLRARLQVAEQSARQGPGAATPAAAGMPAPAPATVVPPTPAAAPPVPVAAVAAAVASGESSQEAALRMLSMAQKTADDTVLDARREADKVLTDARGKADQLERETQDRHRSVVGNLDSERERLERKIEELRSFEREYRARLKSYLEGQLRDLEGRPDGAAPPRPAGAPGAPGSALPSSAQPPGPPVASAPSGPPPAPPGGPAPVPGVQQPARPPSPFSPMPAPPVPGTPQSSEGPSGPPRQAQAGGFEIEEGPEVPPSHG